MRRLAGQAARHTGRLVHALVQLAFAIVLTSIGLLAVLSWRLAQGPLDLPWLAGQLQQAANIDTSAQLTLGSAALAWEGFSGGVDRPLDIRVTDVVVTDAAGKRLAAIPRAAVSLSAGRLLLGQIVPRAIEVDGARLRVLRAADGEVTLDLGDLLDSTEMPPEPGTPEPAPGGLSTSLLREFMRPAVGDRAHGAASRWSQLRRVRIRDAAVSMSDRQLGASWALHALAVDLERLGAGGVSGRADADLQLAGQRAHLGVTATLDHASGHTNLSASLGQIVPATLAREVAAAAALAPFDAPVALSATVQLDPDLAPVHFSGRADIGAGTLHLPQQDTIVLGGALEAEGTPERMAVRLPEFAIAPRPDGKRTILRAHADLTRAATGDIDATAAVDLDQVAFADLPALWPVGVGGPGTRPWIVQNITGGTARNGHVDLGLHIPADFSEAQVTRVEGGIDGDGVTVHWLRPVPPIEDGTARLSFAGTAALAITVTGGRQAGGQGGLRVKGGHALFSGLNEKDQFLDIDADIAGPVVDLLTLLRHPRIKLLDRSPLPVTSAGGQIAGKVTVAHLPLTDALNMDDVNIKASAKLAGLRLAGIAAGHDLDQGALTLDVGPEGLHAGGTAAVAGVPLQLQLDLDFRAGPPTQVLQKIAVTGTIDTAQLAALGLDAGEVLKGSVGLDARISVRRDKQGEATVSANLGGATLTVEPLGFTKPVGRPATLAATVQLNGNAVTGIAPIRLEGEGLRLDAVATFAGGRPDTVTLRHAVLGEGTDMQGEVHLPRRPGDSWRVVMSGASIDAASQFARKPAPPHLAKPLAQPPPGPPYVVDLRFDRVLFGQGRGVTGVVAHVEDDGRVLSRASVTGRTSATGGGGHAGGGSFQFAITPTNGVRRLSVTAADAGGLLLALDIDDKVQGGKLTVTGSYDDSNPGHTLTGTAVMTDFRIHGAPMLARLLQGMTLYGLVELAQGPGLGFSRMDAPFRWSGDVLELHDARAFSPSLGMTAKGGLDLASHSADLNGTIVPAYFFNSLLGNIPLIGKLFSPERGGGLFAATYTVRGPLDDPNVSVNPLAALTPGFLRGAFGLLDGQPATGTAPTPPRERPSK